MTAKLGEITVRVRSIDDPAVQARIVTYGTFNVGMAPSTKLFLSTLGLIFGLLLLVTILVVCARFRHQEKDRYQEERRRRQMYSKQAETDEEMPVDVDSVGFEVENDVQA